MKLTLGAIVASLTVLATMVDASGMIAQVVDSKDFCVFLPPTDATDRLISDNEWNGVAFCMGSTPKATGADKLPSGFIQSAHFVSTSAYVQVTGQIDPTKANLDPTDEGGQYDVRAPTGASCAGWSYFVNLIEPNSGTYCIRCCNDQTNCNRGISQDGCAHIIPGDYSGPSGGSTSPTTTGVSKPTTTKPTATTKASSTTTAAGHTTAITTTPSSSSTTTTTTTTATTDGSAQGSPGPQTTTTASGDNPESFMNAGSFPGSSTTSNPQDSSMGQTSPSGIPTPITQKLVVNAAAFSAPTAFTLIAIIMTLLISI